MALVIAFVLGIGNFALHYAVLESGHPLLGRAPWYIHLLGGRISLAAEFMLLLGALLLTFNAGVTWAWVYGGYTLLNALGGWMILTGRV